jgi:hypothetical protein
MTFVSHVVLMTPRADLSVVDPDAPARRRIL